MTAFFEVKNVLYFVVYKVGIMRTLKQLELLNVLAFRLGSAFCRAAPCVRGSSAAFLDAAPWIP